MSIVNMHRFTPVQTQLVVKKIFSAHKCSVYATPNEGIQNFWGFLFLKVFFSADVCMKGEDNGQ